ncbi:hypothetical protein RIF29_18154 [Crotalaria pallida]|uniref:BTB domain-containing protein n=1 Tax=Crotalaria pallida TaxID=3830 RepID=A0AAN9FPC6_CROPI
METVRIKTKILDEEVHLGKSLLNCIHEIIRASLALADHNKNKNNRTNINYSVDSMYRVETTSRFAQWKIHNLASSIYRKSDPFKISIWNWYLSVERTRVKVVKLYPEISNLTKDNLPIASFIIRLLSSAGDHKAFLAHSRTNINDSMDSMYRVETTSRFTQWKIHNLASSTYRKSDPFKISIWNWYLSVERTRVSVVKLYPEISNLTKDNLPIASFIIRLLSSAGDHKALAHSEIKEKLLSNTEGFVWLIESPLPGKFIIDIEFLDLKISCPNGGDPCSIWPNRSVKQRSDSAVLQSLGRMLTESIHTDITIDACDGSIGAHRAVLAARSPVFHSMFSYNLKEKALSSINISDMSIEACQVFLYYLYGTIKHEEFMTHRLALLHAADKYDICDLREACHESLVEDIDEKNVLERLQTASLYQLPKLKIGCMQYLVKFGKIFHIQDDFAAFLQSADRDLISEVFHEVLDEWKGF